MFEIRKEAARRSSGLLMSAVESGRIFRPREIARISTQRNAETTTKFHTAGRLPSCFQCMATN